MAEKDEYRVFVGGLSWDVMERDLESHFGRYGKILDCQIMMERDTGRPRGFGFVTYADRRGMENAIREMHDKEFGGRVISVNKAQPKMGGDDLDQGYLGGYSSANRGSYGGRDRSAGKDDCFKCGRPGHWARDCPSTDGARGGGGGPIFSRSRFGGAGGRGDRFGDHDRYTDDRYDGGRYGDRGRFDSKDSRYESRDRHVNDRFPSGSGHYPQKGYGKDRGFDRDGASRGGSDRYGSGGPARNGGRSYRSRPDPYDRPSRGGPLSYRY